MEEIKIMEDQDGEIIDLRFWMDDLMFSEIKGEVVYIEVDWKVYNHN
jgi:hypothetical protein